MPEWMKRMHAAVESSQAGRAVRLFLVKVVVHVERRHAERGQGTSPSPASPQVALGRLHTSCPSARLALAPGVCFMVPHALDAWLLAVTASCISRFIDMQPIKLVLELFCCCGYVTMLHSVLRHRSRLLCWYAAIGISNERIEPDQIKMTTLQYTLLYYILYNVMLQCFDCVFNVGVSKLHSQHR